MAIWYIPSLLIIWEVCNCKKYKSNILSNLGNITFELFLIHQLVIRYVQRIFRKMNFDNRYIIFIVAFILSIVTSYLYNYLVNVRKAKKCNK